MSIVERVKEKARRDVKRIVLPEGDEPRTVRAAAILRRTLTPCFFGSGLRLQGVDELLDALDRYTVQPACGSENHTAVKSAHHGTIGRM